MNADSRRLNEISERVIGCAFTVANTLGAGFLEKVYENALAHELTKAGLMVRQKIAIEISGVLNFPVTGVGFTVIPKRYKCETTSRTIPNP